MTIKTKLAVALLASSLAAGCATQKPIAAMPTEGTINRSITWVMSEDPQAACDYHFGKPLIGKRLACARLRGNECTIYVKPPRSEEDRTAIYILGHEALHCFVGQFHYAVN